MDDLRQRSGAPGTFKDTYPSGVIQPFGKPSLSPVSFVVDELKPILRDSRARRVFWLGIFNLICTSILIMWCKSTNSMALSAYTCLTFFDILCLGTCLLSLWVEQQSSNSVFTFGYERFEVLAVFSSTILAQLSSLFIIKESIERLIQPSDIHMGRFLPGSLLAFFCHLIVTYGMSNKALNHVIAASSSSWLQEHVADMSQSISHMIPGLSAVLLPRMNPFVLLGCTGGITLLATHLLVEVYNYNLADTLAAISMAIAMCVTMFPVSTYTGRILLQTTPSYIVGQLDKCLREASTLDGVLEFRHECFWTLAFRSLVGSVHVRIRRDANEQLVLAHLVDRLSNLISDLTIQVFKDEWTWSSTTLQILNESALKFPSLAPTSSSVTLLRSASDYVPPTSAQFPAFPERPVYTGGSSSASPSKPDSRPFSSSAPVYFPSISGSTARTVGIPSPNPSSARPNVSGQSSFHN